VRLPSGLSLMTTKTSFIPRTQLARVVFAEGDYGEPDECIHLELSEIRPVAFDARIDFTCSVAVQGITDAVAHADLVSPVGQPKGRREVALPGEPLQVMDFIQREYPGVSQAYAGT
jgi:hypothetical protein